MQINRFLFEIPCQNTLGENILWHEQEQAIYWTDIEAKTLYKCLLTQEVASILCCDDIDEKAQQAKDEYLNQVLQVFDLPHRLGGFAFTQQLNTIVAGFDKELAIYHYTRAKLIPLSTPELNNEKLRFNDARCDPKGRFWLGTMIEENENGVSKKLAIDEQAALYKIDFVSIVADENKQSAQNTTQTQQISPSETNTEQTSDASESIHKTETHQVLSGLGISNSLCFSQDATLMYHSDSPTHKIYQYTLDTNGNIGERKLLAKFAKNSFPDGCCVDSLGNIWVALWGAACVVCLSPKGKELLRHPLPVTQGSCVAIGGPDMNWLFVSSARQGLSEHQLHKQPRAGNVFVYELSGSTGRIEPLLNVGKTNFESD